jgi:hypothetical protein
MPFLIRSVLRSAPMLCSLTWDACLKYTNVELELITDPDIFLFFESAMRGGISVISNRYARANNPYLEREDYNSSQPHSYIYYLDANNMYRCAMSQYLPVGGFRFLPEEEILQIDFSNVADDTETEFIVEYDVEYLREVNRGPQRLSSGAETRDGNGGHVVSVL